MATTTKDKTLLDTLPTSLPPWVVLLILVGGSAGSGGLGAWAGGVSAAQVEALDVRVNTLEHSAAAVQPVTERRLSEVEATMGRVDARLERLGSNQIRICAALQVSCRE